MNNYRIETEEEVRAYLANLKYALKNGAEITFEAHRRIDTQRAPQYTNAYTLKKLFPNEAPDKALRKELLTLTPDNYLRTVKDSRFPARSEMREFGKIYNSADEVYIKIRVELLNTLSGNHTTYVMSFHFAERPFNKEVFPYARKEASHENFKEGI